MILTTSALITIITISTATGIGIGSFCMYIKNKRDEAWLYEDDNFPYDEMVGEITPFETIKK